MDGYLFMSFVFQFADENNINFYEVSAKNKNNVNKVSIFSVLKKYFLL